MLEPMGKQNTRTKSIRNGFFKHKYITNPTVSPKNAVIAAAANLADALKIPHHLK